jgi:protein-S-isoprenylcysteine O-methyltransferase Ste14
MTIAQMQEAILALWVALVLIWLLSASRVKQTRWREPLASQAVYTGLILAAAALMFAPEPYLPAVLKSPLGLRASTAVAVGLAATALGVGFAMWARLRLGSNWSAAVTVKEGHSLIRTGPYRFVRHPMYSGFLLGFAGTALASDQLRAVPALALVLIGRIYKSRVEEAQLAVTFPDYQQYRRKTAALIPFIY